MNTLNRLDISENAPKGKNSKLNIAQLARNGVGLVLFTTFLATFGSVHAAAAKSTPPQTPPDDNAPTMPSSSPETEEVAESNNTDNGLPEGVELKPELFIEFQDFTTEEIEAGLSEGIDALEQMKRIYPVGEKMKAGSGLTQEDRNTYNELVDQRNLSSKVHEVLDKEALDPDDYAFLLEQYKILLQHVQNDVKRHVDILAYLHYRFQLAEDHDSYTKWTKGNNEGIEAFMAVDVILDQLINDI